MNPPEDGPPITPLKERLSGKNGHLKLESSSTPTLDPFASLLKDSKKSWHQPTNIKQLVSQINAVSTMVLNGKANVEVARAYSALVRTIAQTMSIELTRARLEKSIPFTTIDDDVFED